MYLRSWTLSVTLGLFVVCSCSGLPRPRTEVSVPARRFGTTVRLHGSPLDLHLSAPLSAAAPRVLVVYASGDGGWFGAAVSMFDEIARAGYYTAGFSSRAFLKIARPPGGLVSAAQVSEEYGQIIAQARRALGLDGNPDVVLSGWSRGAAFAVLVGAEPPAGEHLLGVVAIGLSQGEDLQVNGAGDETDEGQAPAATGRWPFDTYERIARVPSIPCAVIQSTHDDYLPSAGARGLFGPDTPLRRFYAIDARNHRFSGGQRAFDAALVDALGWIASGPGTSAPLAITRAGAGSPVQ